VSHGRTALPVFVCVFVCVFGFFQIWFREVKPEGLLNSMLKVYPCPEAEMKHVAECKEDLPAVRSRAWSSHIAPCCCGWPVTRCECCAWCQWLVPIIVFISTNNHDYQLLMAISTPYCDC
jgi:hypothetical protein